MDQHQVDIFSDSQQHRQFAELCNALYERELLTLAQQKITNTSLLQRRLAGLTHHIRRAAEFLLTSNAPIDVDVHNGSWQSKQAATCMASRIPEEKIEAWYHKHVRFGLAVPIYVSDMGLEHLELDSVDRIDEEKRRVHVNKHRWFHFNGAPWDKSECQLSTKKLLQPTKTTMSAACCGHTWNHKGRAQPRALSLRELLLSGNLDWKHFR